MNRIFKISLRVLALLQLVLLVVQLSSCKKDLPLDTQTGYPSQINTIIETQCAVTGCHNAQSMAGAGGLNLETWTTLFQGGDGGAEVIPYTSNQSWVCFYTNIWSDLGISLAPTMPANRAPITRDQEILIQNWVNSGAPDINGNVAFCCDANRDKFYVSNQGCDLVTVFDSKTKLAMRYITVGVSEVITDSHCIRVSPDNKYWYVIFSVFGTVVQKFDATTDQLIGNIPVGLGGGQGAWNDLIISADGNYGVLSDWEASGEVVLLDLNNLSVIDTFSGLTYPHGLAATPDFSTIYCTGASGNNFAYSLTYFNLNPKTFQLQNGGYISLLRSFESPGTILTPHDLILTPDLKHLLVSCQTDSDIRIINTATNTLDTVIPVGDWPQEFAISHKYPYIFLACQESADPFLKTRGSVYIFNYNTFQIVKVFNEQFYEPHDIAVDDAYNLLIVPSRNIASTGPAPHHVSYCGGRDGFLNLIDLTTLSFVPGIRTELSVDPYFAAARSMTSP